jgi:hypothetical protein
VPSPPYLSYLRILIPVDTLPAYERTRWESYARTAPGRTQLEQDQFERSIARLAGHPPVLVPEVESDAGLVLEVHGVLHVCPLQPRLQAWLGLEAGADQSDPVLASQPGATVPEALRKQAAADLARYLAEGGNPRLFTRVARWRVPIAWFVLFDSSERRLLLGGHDDGQPRERVLRYRTQMSSARRRGAIALRTARRHLADVEVAEDIERICRWLEEFDPRSLVELDYGGLVHLVDDDHLRSDDSVADVAAGLEALADGDAGTAAAAYQRLATRWGRIALMARSS